MPPLSNVFPKNGRLTIITFFHVRIFPESARWLAVKGHLTQAHAVLTTYAKRSSLSVDSDSLSKDLADYYHNEVELKASSSSWKTPFLDLIRTPRLRKRTIILCLNW